jgi:hypothetical protein
MLRSIEATATAAGVMITDEPRAADSIFSVHAIGVGVGGNIVVEYSNDGVNYVAAQGTGPGAGGAPAAALTAANSMLVYYVQARFYRVRLTAITSGTASVVVSIGEGWSK